MKLYEITNISLVELLILSLAVYRITRLIVTDSIFDPLREKVFKRFSQQRSSIGYLLTCTWCMSLWVSLPTVLFYAFNPSITLLVGCIFALSAVASLITALVDER
jgi:hypothetical protein